VIRWWAVGTRVRVVVGSWREMVGKIQSGTRLLALNRGNRTGTVMSRSGTLSITLLA
jgi:hypothetical protein